MMARGLRLAGVFLFVNLVWEFAQLPLYTMWRSEPWPRIAFALFHCTVGDMLIGGSALGFALIVAGRGWPPEARARRRVAILTTLVGVAYTIFSEWLNVEIRHAWAYTDLMPRLPPLGTGLTPVLQWLFLPGLSLMLATRVSQTSPTSRADATSAPPPRNTQHVQ
jgi:hypothetical protein